MRRINLSLSLSLNLSLLLLLLLPVLALAPAGCQQTSAVPGPAAPAHIDGLGSASLPNSGNAAAQTPFLRGLLLLHSFEYGPAAAAFREAQEADPEFALAYWGEAMTCNHPLWQQRDVEAARAVLGRLGPTPEARAAKAGTARERAYLAAVETLYADGTKTDRDAAYLGAMQALLDAHPDDDEARAFLALAILGSRDGDRDFATYMRAAATAQPVFDANPDHPGAAHYLIHSFDDPVHAPLGLPAARRYAGIAPEASHAQHMTSHIFVALGMWDDVVAANVRAMDTQNAQNVARGDRANVCGHYSSWLQYGYLMQGETDQAAALLDACHARMSDAPTGGERGYFASMRARQIIDTRDWSLADKWAWQPDPADAESNAARDYAFADAYAAIQRDGKAAAPRTLAAGAPWPEGRLRLQQDAIRGLVALADGRDADAIRLLRAAADAEDALPFEFGPPAVLKPTRELLAEVLEQLGRSDEAKVELDRAAERTPGRLK
jgi:tetratricopeptide (TPR) repeat protein